MTDFNIALIGCGRISGHHATSIQQTPGIRLAAVCDIEKTRADDCAKAYGVPAFDNYHQMLGQMDQIDLAINTPSGMHLEHAIDIITPVWQTRRRGEADIHVPLTS